MEAIVKNSMRSIPTAMPIIHQRLEMAIAMVMIPTIQPSVASMEAIVKTSMQSIPTAMPLLGIIHGGLEMAVVMVVPTIQ
jgi:hypothetical protein